MRAVVPLLTLLLGLAAGWFFASDAKRTRPNDSPPPVGKSEQAGTSRGDGRSGGPGTRAGRADITRLLEYAFASGRIDYPALRHLMAALAALSTDNVTEFTAFFRKQELEQQQILLWQLFFAAWGEIDPEGAIAFIEERFQQTGARRLFYAAVLELWKTRDPAGALDFALEGFLTPDSGIDARLAVEYLRTLSESDPAQALQLATKLGDGEFLFELTAQRISQLGKKDPQLALDALATLEAELYNHAASRFVADWAKDDPAAAAEWLAGAYIPEFGIFTLTQVAAAYVQSDPTAALKWIEDLPVPESRARILAEAVQAWSQNDPDGAAGWMRQLDARPEYDPAVAALASRLADQNAQGVIEEWLPRITDAQSRMEVLSEVSLGWQRENMGEFTEWLEQTTSLSPEIKQRLLAREVPGRDAPPAPTPPQPPGDNEQGR